MKPRRAGARHPLLFYRRTMDRVGWSALILGVVVGVSGWFSLIAPRNILGFHSDIWFFALAAIAFALAAFAFVARFLAYVQPRDGFLLIATPFLRLRISYQRIQSLRPMLMQQVFPPDRLTWAQRGFIDAFYGKTALVVDLLSYPMSPAILKLFLPDAMFARDRKGIVLMTPDWMKLSTEIDSFYGNWLQTQRRRK